MMLMIAIAAGSLGRYRGQVRKHYTGRGGGTTVKLRDSWEAKVKGRCNDYWLAAADDRRVFLSVTASCASKA
jgi:hypothetical protein